MSMQRATAQNTEDRVQETQRRRAILVIGMHRSGTSALAGTIRLLGATPPNTLLQPNEYNSRGYWECGPLMAVHEEFLDAIGSRWKDFRRLDPVAIESSKTAQRFRSIIKDTLSSEYGDAPLFFVKDPRISRFVPFFVSVLEEDLGAEAVAMLTLRNPLAVANSLKRRDHMSIPRAFALWMRYMLDAEYCSRHLKRHLVTYEGLLKDWQGELDRATDGMGIIRPSRPDPASTPESVSVGEYLSADLRHENHDDDMLARHPDASPLLIETYRILQTLWSKGESKALAKQLDSIRLKFDEACEIFGPMMEAEDLAARAREEEMQKAGELELSGTRLELAKAKQELQREAETLRELNARYAALQKTLQLREDEIQICKTSVRNLKVNIRKLERSWSWRITAPLRKTNRIVRRIVRRGTHA